MKIRSRRIICFALQSILLAVLVVPSLARVGIQCPFPLLTQHTAINAVNGLTMQLSYNQNDPRISTDPACRNTNAANFTTICPVDINSVTGQASGKTVNPVFLNTSSITFGNASTATRLANFAFVNMTSHVRCRSITCGDGHALMGDRDRTGNADLAGNGDTYIFGFKDVTGVPPEQVLPLGFAGSQHLAPTMVADQGEELWLTLTNAGMRERPDLFDAHTVHYHGFPNAASAFDGEPMASFGINIGSSLTYYYKNEEPGTYMWHCHVEAAEHMQMGMLGQLYVNPKQDAQLAAAPAINASPTPPVPPFPTSIGGFTKFAYNDCTTYPVVSGVTADPMCGATGYNILKPVEITSFDPTFHYFDQTYQKVRFDLMNDTYPMFNGRGYPDTIVRNPIINNGTPFDPAHVPSQPLNTVIQIPVGQKALIRMPSLSTVDFYTVTILGIPFQVVGQGARLLRGPDPGIPGQFGLSTVYKTNSVTLGGGEAYDIIVDTTGVTPGTYFMYSTNLNALNNDSEDYGGMMTEIVVTN